MPSADIDIHNFVNVEFIFVGAGVALARHSHCLLPLILLGLPSKVFNLLLRQLRTVDEKAFPAMI